MSVGSQGIPDRLEWPLGLAAMGLGIVGFTLGYVLVALGVTLYFDLNGFGEAITTVESLTVVGFGVVACLLGYLGWRGFLRFSY